ncbi:hypothetical protein FDV58_17750 [Bradyrhizobium elkanii]|uniref:Uncharacterized protein n=1 Tax=Bradyrhizobium elkanii TaxID=29448 RepID=A0A4V6CXD3_BRAEL|nr:hypothetical protein FDV58_17750 [Bradyrhizobium elkanii]
MLDVEAGKIDRLVKHAGIGAQLLHLAQVENDVVGVNGLRLHIDGDQADTRHANEIIRPLDLAAQGLGHGQNALVEIDVRRLRRIEPDTARALGGNAVCGILGRNRMALSALRHVPLWRGMQTHANMGVQGAPCRMVVWGLSKAAAGRWVADV